MLKLINIEKNYYMGSTTVQALKKVNLEFRKSEFVAILGPSGCGKTTLLNLIGGLDRYTDGDIVINKKSTKEYKDADWDAYRNHSIGFVFQNYNLIPHLKVLSNVELALTLSGISIEERKKRAIDALNKVGLHDQIYKLPNQLSGGQMQRVAIARALVNDPDILLADEPTGALDSETSIQIMEILKEVAKDRLVIMVTHNPDLANQYATRIIRLLDGVVISDSNPYQAEVAKKDQTKGERLKHTSMSFLTALALSFQNLLTKKARTILTAFAGSIGIIGIALVLALSNGFQSYVDKMQADTLSSYPLIISRESVDFASAAELNMDTSLQ
ncbi:MAG TPA: ABC transporter ATP-binding protein, partial [Bacilli bacterium]|nr:ABC transporter ATP-binding protein [Bacilli bacterium]